MSRRRIGVLALVAGIVLVGSASGSDALRVHEDQHFIGVVNGNHTSAVVYTACPGPVIPGQAGHPTGGQFVAAILVQQGGGFTGSGATSIRVTFADDPSATVELARYGVARRIPTELELPCTGSGSVSFAASPASAVSTPDIVKVTYENIAV